MRRSLATGLVLPATLVTVLLTRLPDSGFDPGVFHTNLPPAEAGAWGPVRDWHLQAMHIVVLPGRVLLISEGHVSGVWNPTGDAPPVEVPFPGGDLHCAAQATLADGRAIVVGGTVKKENEGIPVTALFDPVASSWKRGADMHRNRWYPTATVLADGRVFVASGTDSDRGTVSIPEVYDPRSDAWTALPAAEREQQLYPFMFLLPDGQLFDAGPQRNTWYLDLASGRWTPGPRNEGGPGGGYPSAVMYSPGKILLAGGGHPPSARAAVVDLTRPEPRWREVGPMNSPRMHFTLVILADGSVMAAGGSRYHDETRDALYAGEIWNPESEEWTGIATMREPRMYHSAAALLPDGRVLVGGGQGRAGRHAQIYSPPYLFHGPRPTITAAPESAVYGGSLVIEASAAPGIERVALLRPAAVTHGFDHNQRYVPLTFRREGDALVAAAPPDGNLAPPGDYLLVLVDGNGVPSEGHWLRLSSR